MSYFNTPFGHQKDQLPIEEHRYRFIWAAPCPFASRAKITLDLLGLNDIISVGEVNPINTDGWSFGSNSDDSDEILEVHNLKELYQRTEPNYTGSYSVPVLVDVQSGSIIRNESADIVRDFNLAFHPFHDDLAPNLYPEYLRQEIDQHNLIIGQDLNYQEYAIAKAQNQTEYNQAIQVFFDHLKQIDTRLAMQTFYHGEELTETDIYLYVILCRFDAVYYYLWDANAYRIEDFPHLWNYLKQLYQIPAFKDNTPWEKIKKGIYLSSHGQAFHSRQIIPIGHDLSKWKTTPQ